MRHAVVLVIALVGLGFAGGWLTRAQTQARPPVKMMHIYTDRNGKTRAEQIDLALRPSTTPPERGSLDASTPVAAGQATVLRTSGDYFSDFHAVGSRRYIVMMSGEREYEVSDGQKFRLRPGDVMLVEDTSGTGHVTRGIGGDSVNMLITLTDPKP